MGSQDWVPADIDTERPSVARIYDYWLGGAHNFEVDRRVAEQMLAAYPDGRRKIWANRAFLRRAVEFLVGEGVRQFLDVGSGIPTVGHVHEVAQALAPESRVVFVDIDPVAVAHTRMILAENDLTAAIQQDVRQPELIWAAPETRLLDLSEPVAVLAVALFHFIPDADDPAEIIAQLTAPLVSGSYLALSHGTDDGGDDSAELAELNRRAGIDWSSRPYHQVEAFFAGHDLVEPGLVWAPLWRADSIDDPYRDNPEHSSVYAGVGRKR